MTDKELFYRNVDIGDGEEVAVKATQGYGQVVEIIIEENIVDMVVRLSPSGALALGKAITDAAQVLLRS